MTDLHRQFILALALFFVFYTAIDWLDKLLLAAQSCN